jgi:DNA-binding NtrC family response regulator
LAADKLPAVVQQALNVTKMSSQVHPVKENLDPPVEIDVMAKSAEMKRRVMALVGKVAPTDVPVLDFG